MDAKSCYFSPFSGIVIFSDLNVAVLL